MSGPCQPHNSVDIDDLPYVTVTPNPVPANLNGITPNPFLVPINPALTNNRYEFKGLAPEPGGGVAIIDHGTWLGISAGAGAVNLQQAYNNGGTGNTIDLNNPVANRPLDISVVNGSNIGPNTPIFTVNANNTVPYFEVQSIGTAPVADNTRVLINGDSGLLITNNATDGVAPILPGVANNSANQATIVDRFDVAALPLNIPLTLPFTAGGSHFKVNVEYLIVDLGVVPPATQSAALDLDFYVVLDGVGAGVSSLPNNNSYTSGATSYSSLAGIPFVAGAGVIPLTPVGVTTGPFRVYTKYSYIASNL